ncbi:hypothetical protein DFH09DRAFT_1275835 [Mycena vulgaris]|nr:hypothetical protein DFH09DRAFT_1275835 [Mycena vulgaris]
MHEEYGSARGNHQQDAGSWAQGVACGSGLPRLAFKHRLHLKGGVGEREGLRAEKLHTWGASCKPEVARGGDSRCWWIRRAAGSGERATTAWGVIGEAEATMRTRRVDGSIGANCSPIQRDGDPRTRKTCGRVGTADGSRVAARGSWDTRSARDVARAGWGSVPRPKRSRSRTSTSSRFARISVSVVKTLQDKIDLLGLENQEPMGALCCGDPTLGWQERRNRGALEPQVDEAIVKQK